MHFISFSDKIQSSFFTWAYDLFTYFCHLSITIAVLLISNTTLANHSNQSYTFGVVPQQSTQQVVKNWSPVLDYIYRQSGIKLQVKTAKNLLTFENRLAAGEYDFAYMSPYQFTVFNQDPGYHALVVRRDQPIRGILVVRKDSDIHTLSDLSNKTLVFPSPDSFAASMITRSELNKKHIPFTPRYVSSHDSVYLNVAKGIFPAGGGVMQTLKSMTPALQAKLRVLWMAPPYTPHAIAVLSGIKSNIYRKIQQAFVDMLLDQQGRKLLRTLQIKHGFKIAVDSDWNDVQSIKQKLLYQLIE